MSKFYLGDGVYFESLSYGVKLFTNNGYETTNEIYLEPDVIVMFEEVLKKVRQQKCEGVNRSELEIKLVEFLRGKS